jgi:SpoIID/LytB domain protein
MAEPLTVQTAAAASPGSLVVEGGGWGHSIGMTQYGARAMALEGRTFDQILTHYYTGAFLSTVAESGISPTLWVNLQMDRSVVTLAPVALALTASIDSASMVVPVGSRIALTTVDPTTTTTTTSTTTTSTTTTTIPEGTTTTTLAESTTTTAPEETTTTTTTVPIETTTTTTPVETTTTTTIPTPTGFYCQVTLDGTNAGTGCNLDIPLDPATGAIVEILGCSLTDWQNPGGSIGRPCRYDRGTLHVRLDRQQQLTVSLEIDLEDYMLGISEMPYRWAATGAAAALQAQAVAARTYALRRAGERWNPVTNPGSPPDCWCNLYDTSTDQAYVGYGHLQPEWTAAVTSTAGVILSHASEVQGTQKRPILAVYSSSSAGFTESSGQIWQLPLPYLVGVDDHWSQLPESGNPNMRWRREITAQQLRDANFGVGDIVDITLTNCSPSGFGLGFRVVGTTSTRVVSTRTLSGMLSPQVISAGMGGLPTPACWPATAPRRDTMDLRISGIVVNDGTTGDALGDGDGLLECGERAELTAQFTAQAAAKPGLEVFTRILSPEGSPLWNASSWLPAIPQGEMRQTTSDFEVLITPTVSQYEWLTFEAIVWDRSTGALFQSHRHMTISCGVTGVSSAVPAPIVFPVVGGGPFGDTWLAARPELIHEGVDIFKPKLTPVVAVADGVITDVNWIHDPAYVPPNQCCAIVLRHANGWESWYLHLNNDNAGTDDGLGWGVAPGIERGVSVTAGQIIGWVGDSGNAENTSPHLHYELHTPAGIPINPYTLLQAAAVVTAPTCGPAGGCAPSVSFGRGSRGSFVSDLQNMLNRLGFSAGRVDGIFGAITQGAVFRFQGSASLPQNGWVDGPTWAALVEAFTNPPPPVVVPPPLVSMDLRRGARGAVVRELQTMLNALGFSAGRIDGIFGSVTQGAVWRFQGFTSLPETGWVDGTTWVTLIAAFNPTPGVTPPPPVVTIDIRRGARGAVVRELQTMLNALGFSAGRIDGIFGSITQGAVTRFQASRSIPQTGWVDDATWAALQAAVRP